MGFTNITSIHVNSPSIEIIRRICRDQTYGDILLFLVLERPSPSRYDYAWFRSILLIIPTDISDRFNPYVEWIIIYIYLYCICPLQTQTLNMHVCASGWVYHHVLCFTVQIQTRAIYIYIYITYDRNAQRRKRPTTCSRWNAHPRIAGVDQMLENYAVTGLALNTPFMTTAWTREKLCWNPIYAISWALFPLRMRKQDLARWPFVFRTWTKPMASQPWSKIPLSLRNLRRSTTILVAVIIMKWRVIVKTATRAVWESYVDTWKQSKTFLYRSCFLSLLWYHDAHGFVFFVFGIANSIDWQRLIWSCIVKNWPR